MGCAAPQYAIRPTPVPEESAWAVELERTISAQQAQALERQDARLLGSGERLWGFDVHRVLMRLSRVTERPGLPYHVFLLQDPDPNAISLADGRVYVTSGMLDYLSSRGSREEELAAVLSHELKNPLNNIMASLDTFLEEAGKEAQLLVGNFIDFGTLENFRSFDAYVNTACPRIRDDVELAKVPLLNLDDLAELLKLLKGSKE